MSVEEMISFFVDFRSIMQDSLLLGTDIFQWILMTFYKQVESGPRTSHSDFGSNLVDLGYFS